MPVGWLTIGTPEELELLLESPPDFEDEVDRRIAAAGAVTVGIFWERVGGPAHVVAGVPERDAEAVFDRLDRAFETKVRRLWNVHELRRGGGEAA
ncbi:MAG TPA: hypothetical protein VFA56_02125 [Gaiellaceae bacterium]|nr:hypothetical protein [Gaiellaceae bacterium]